MTVTIVGARIAIPTTREIMPRERSPHVCRLCLPVKACADIWHMSRLSFRGRARCVGASCRFLPCSPALAVEATTDSPAAGPCRAGPKWRGHAGRRCRPREAGCRGSHRAEENAGSCRPCRRTIRSGGRCRAAGTLRAPGRCSTAKRLLRESKTQPV